MGEQRLLMTGSNRGIGFAVAEAFHRAGYRIASLNRTLKGESWLGEIRCDLRDRGEVDSALSCAVGRMDGFDVCILNAAVRSFSPIETMGDQVWDQTLETNLSAVFRIARRLIPVLRQTRGHFVIMGSHAGSHAFEGGVAYCVSKAGLRALAEVLIMETRSAGVRTTLVNAGAVANRPMKNSKYKIQPATVAALILQVVSCPTDAIVGEIEIRPAHPLTSPAEGIKRLQYL